MIDLADLGLGGGALLAAAALAWAAASDLTRFLIPNRACALVALGYVLAAGAMPTAIWLWGLAVGLMLLALGAALFARGLVGGGDVKLAAAIGLWAGPGFLAVFAQGTAIV